jgi:integrase/recombinase XerD
MEEASLAQAIDVATRKAFGKHIGPHQFRHIVATEIATNNPDDASDIAAVMAHSSIEVSEKYYDHARGIEAVRAYHATVSRESAPSCGQSFPRMLGRLSDGCDDRKSGPPLPRSAAE